MTAVDTRTTAELLVNRVQAAIPMACVASFDKALTDRVVALLGPVVDYSLPLSPLGRRTVWAAVADRLVTALLPSGRTHPDMPAPIARVERIMAGAGPPGRRGPSRQRRDGRRRDRRRRGGPGQ